MRRSICYCEPNNVKAGDVFTWKFCYSSSADLPKGTLLKFDLLSKNREKDWEIPQTNLKRKTNIIFATLPNGAILQAKQVGSSSFEFELPIKISSGKPFIINMGSTNKKQGNRSQTYTQRKRKFTLKIAKNGKEYNQTEHFYLDVKGNILDNLRIIVPSFVSRNKRFDVIVRFEDSFGNLTGLAEENTLIELSYRNLRENLNWKLFVPETGFITLPNLYFNEAGIYRIQLKNLKNRSCFLSSPIKCFDNSDKNLYWGMFHGESENYTSTNDIENCLRSFRDIEAIQFYSTSHFDSVEETSNETWKKISPFVAEFNEDFRFTSFLGLQWVGDHKVEGVRQFIYLKDNKPILRKDDLKTNSLKKIYKIHQSKDIMAIPSFTMGKDSIYDFKQYNEEFERVIEIYNAWGSSECTEKEGNLRPIHGKCHESKEGSVQKALNENCRFGFVAGGLDDRGIYKKFYDTNQKQYSAGLTAIIASNQTKEDLFKAIYKRSCYATTGKRILIQFSIANEALGSELDTKKKPGLVFNRFITGEITGTSELKKIEIIRNGKVFKTFNPDKEEFSFKINDNENLDKISINSKDERPNFVYYYIRVIQKDNHMAWASPIWIDLVK